LLVVLPESVVEESMVIDKRIKTVIDWATCGFAVVGYKGKRIACDGRIMVACGLDLADKATYPIAAKVPEKWEEIRAVEMLPAIKGPLIGSFGYAYVRKVMCGAEFAYVAEWYIRCFPEDAQWEITRDNPAEGPVRVGLNGEMIGVVMPISNTDGWLDGLPEIPFLEDEALYHVCECEFCDYVDGEEDKPAAADLPEAA
jgi:hypothetical protein